MKIKFDQPKTVGDLQHQITINEMVLTHLAISLEPRLTDQGKATVSIGLLDPESGYFINEVLYENEDALAFWRQINTGNVLSKQAIQKLVDDGKLSGAVS